jgi:hypothetical protein
VLARRDHNLAAVQHEAVAHQDRLIAVPVDSFRGDFQFIHGLFFSPFKPLVGLLPEVMKITYNMILSFIQFLFRYTNFQEQFWIADCGLRIADLLYRFALSIFIKLISRRRT